VTVIVNRAQSIYEMRDLYNRKARLVYWIQRIHTDLKDHESDRKDVLKFVNHLQEKDKSILWIIRCITALLQLRREIGKPFSQVTKDDIKKLFDWMKRKEYKASTHEKYRVILKTLAEYKEYLKQLIKKYNIKPSGNIKKKD